MIELNEHLQETVASILETGEIIVSDYELEYRQEYVFKMIDSGPIEDFFPEGIE